MGRNAAVSATTALRLLNNPELRHQPATGPQLRRATSSTSGAPLNLGLVDYLDAHVNEVVTHVRSLPGHEKATLPAQPADLYDWYIEHTGTAPAAEQAHRDYITERHALEHAIALGEYNAVRPHPCPSCGSWGLFWDQRGNRARCSDVDCRTPDGLASTFTLARLAAQKAQRTENWRRSAT